MRTLLTQHESESIVKGQLHLAKVPTGIENVALKTILGVLEEARRARHSMFCADAAVSLASETRPVRYRPPVVTA